MTAPVEVRALVRCRCGKCHGNPDAKPHEDSVTIVGRDALVQRCGLAIIAIADAERKGPGHAAAVSGELGNALAALRTWDAGTEGGGSDVG